MAESINGSIFIERLII